jgi:hypothetical protein
MSKFTEVLGNKRCLSVEDRVKSVLDEESYKDFEAALKNKGIPCAAICRALKDMGIETSEASINRWRNK